MSHNVTLSAVISPTQLLAVEALAGGSSVTEAAKAAGVVRETVSRWVHHDPVFLAELHNTRADLAAQTRSALEALGMTAVATLREALQDLRMRPTRLRAACAILKMIGADRAETLAPTTPLDMHLRLREREEEIRQRQAKLDASELNAYSYPADVTPGTEPEFPGPAATAEGHSGGSGTAPGWPDPDERIAGESPERAPEPPAAQAARNPGSDEPAADHPHADSGRTAMEQVQDMPLPTVEDESSEMVERQFAGSRADSVCGGPSSSRRSSAPSTSKAPARIRPRLDTLRARQEATQPSPTCRKAW